MDDLPPGFDESKFEQAMEQLAREADGLDDEDPRQAARMMRKLYESTGMKLSDKMEEAMRRMESGEDPDKIEEEMGDVLDEEDPLFGGEPTSAKIKGLSKKPPAAGRRYAVRSGIAPLGSLTAKLPLNGGIRYNRSPVLHKRLRSGNRHSHGASPHQITN